jgi:hypothetical protein
MPTRRYKNITYRDNMTAGELAAWHHDHPDGTLVVTPARAMLKPTHGLTLRADDGGQAAAPAADEPQPPQP